MPDTENGKKHKDREELRAAVARAIQISFGAVLRLEPANMDPLVVDGRGDDCVIADGVASDEQPACVWRASRDTFLRVLEGGRGLEGAYMSSRLHISGDMSVMARLQLEPKI